MSESMRITIEEIIDINPAAIMMIGAEKDEILNRICHKYICPAESDHCPITDLHQIVDNSERVLLTRDGRKIPIIKYVVSFNFQGRDCLLETFIDNSERKKAEEGLQAAYEQISGTEEELRSQFNELCILKNELEANETKYRAIVETSPDIIWDIKPDGTFSYVSPRSLDILGYTPEELTGSSIISFLASEAVEKVKGALNEAGPRKRELISIDVPVIHRDGTILLLNARFYPLTDSAGNLIDFRGIGRDITDRMKSDVIK